MKAVSGGIGILGHHVSQQLVLRHGVSFLDEAGEVAEHAELHDDMYV